MSVRVLHFDVFTAQRGKGNPAGIVLSADGISDGDMQRIATATGFPDTAFLTRAPGADFRIRFFSTRRETKLCGHAAIAASIALHTRGDLAGQALPLTFSLATRAGVLPIRIETSATGEPLVVMTQAPAQFRAFEGDRDKLARALGLSRSDLHPTLPILYGSTGRWTLVVPTRGLEVMGRMVPDPMRYAEALVEMPGASVHPFCLECVGADVHMHARHFSSPGSGTLEDPVTGTASGVLGAYYRTFIGNDSPPQPLVIEQGCEIGREGRVLVWTAPDPHGGYGVRIGGIARFIEELFC